MTAISREQIEAAINIVSIRSGASKKLKALAERLLTKALEIKETQDGK